MDEPVSKRSIEEIDRELEEQAMRKLEAALFLAGRYMSIEELISLTDINPILLRKLLFDLQERYKGSGIQIVQRENFWKMDIAEEFSFLANKLATGKSEFSEAEKETLALIAYKQPVKQSIVIKIRGNKAYEHVRRFVEMGLVHKKKLGHTHELSLTDKFYEYFRIERQNEKQVFPSEE
ncbi:SMC-Scp complex subunit ScpB [Candidatus Pacearchaeota archaeon]|nr:MAG: SMC-Scp complex subunit ScpB [Candidatus Pacearchaeota archaeon]